ncbi:MAG: class II aldolase [Clostridia bacterium]|nr:class II aldolase [Clostridia bacterium]
MPLVNMKDLLCAAQKGGYAVGSFSIANMEMILGVIKAAEETKSPIILQIAEVRLNHSPLHIIGPAMIGAAKNAKVPVAVHLDHGTSLRCIKEALELGFTSVMFDGSHLPIEENIAMTKEVMAMAKPYGAAVEAEIGCVGGSEDGSKDIAMRCTSPDQAKHFYDETRVDALAIAIGNAHGFYKEAPCLRFDILEKVRDTVDVPLVLHGGTGIEPEDFIRCHQSGIKKINIATATFASVEKQVRSDYAENKIGGYYDLHQSEIEGAYKNAKAHMEIFYSVGKAE